MATRTGEAIERLVGIMARLRAPGGCPWDREQDLASLRPYLIEEAFEVLDEMDRVAAGGAWAPYCEELGDLLFQIVFHAQLASERSAFALGDVANAISDKIVRRHPHVFPRDGEAQQVVAGAEQVLQNWALLKAEERKEKHGHAGSVLDGVPTRAPSLMRAERLTEKASRIGFDWPDLASVRAKLDEELAELDEAARSGDRAQVEAELGDVLFSTVNLARFLKVPAEDALRQTVRKFVRRFHRVEEGLRRAQVPFGQATLETMDALWNEAKEEEHTLPPPRHPPQADLAAIWIDCPDLAAVAAFWRKAGPPLGLAQVPSPAGEWQLGHPTLSVRYRQRAGAPPSAVSLGLALPPWSWAPLARALGEAGVQLASASPLGFVDPANVHWTAVGE
jgi:ATP diphosphatase